MNVKADTGTIGQTSTGLWGRKGVAPWLDKTPCNNGKWDSSGFGSQSRASITVGLFRTVTVPPPATIASGRARHSEAG